MIKELSAHERREIDFVPVATIRGDIDVIARKMAFRTEHGEDDLDEYRAAYLRTEHGCLFILLQYEGSKRELVDIFLPTKLENYRQCIDDILGELRIPKRDVIPREVAYERL